MIPRGLAKKFTEGRARHWQHIQKVIEARKQKALQQRRELLEKLKNVQLTFHVLAAPDSDKIFGSIRPHDISHLLEQMGFMVDKRDIELEAPIQSLGQFKATVNFGQGLKTEIIVTVERANSGNKES